MMDGSLQQVQRWNLKSHGGPLDKECRPVKPMEHENHLPVSFLQSSSWDDKKQRLQAMKAQVKDLKKSLGIQAVQNHKPTKEIGHSDLTELTDLALGIMALRIEGVSSGAGKLD